MFTMFVNAVVASAAYIMDKMSPVTNWRVRVMPKRNPMFHMNEIEAGVGRSRRDLFIIFRRGLVFVSCFFIRRKLRLIDLDCIREF